MRGHVRVRSGKTTLEQGPGHLHRSDEAYTQVKMEDAHKLLKIPKSECPDIYLDSSTTTQMAGIMVQYGRPIRSS